MILSSTSPYALLKEFSIACGFTYDAVFRVCLNNFCERLQCSVMNYLVRLNYLVLPRVTVMVRVSSVVVSIIQFPLFVG